MECPKDPREVPAAHGHAVRRRQIQIDDRETESVLLGLLDRFPASAGGLDAPSTDPQGRTQALPAVSVRVDDQDAGRLCRRFLVADHLSLACRFYHTARSAAN